MVHAGAIALAEVLAESRVLEYIDVRDNDIRIAGLMALSLAHRLNHQILHLSVPKNIKCDPVRWCGLVRVCVLLFRCGYLTSSILHSIAGQGGCSKAICRH